MRMSRPAGLVAALLLVFLLGHSCVVELQAGSDSDLAKVHIVYLGKNVHPNHEVARNAHHHILMNVFKEKEAARASVVYNYRKGLNGFSAKLTDNQAADLKKVPGVLRVYPSISHHTQTTRSWEYLGLKASDPAGPWREAGFGSDVIVGMIDTGIWPESKSFNDAGLSPPPARWRGECVEGEVKGENFTRHCNNKLIGARYYVRGYESRQNSSVDSTLVKSPRDTQGHGSHTSSTVAGRMVRNQSYYGLAPGNVSGGVPSAKLAVYKACWGTCEGSDLLAAFDDAIGDGVDLISISIAGPPDQYFSNSIAIGSFHANLHGILVSSAAGNNGPGLGTVANVAPWMLTVAANTLDRELTSQITLGGGAVVQGLALNTYDTLHKIADKTYPLVYGGDITSEGFSNLSLTCAPGTLNASLARGKVIICESFIVQPNGSRTLAPYRVDDSVQAAGGVGVIPILFRNVNSSSLPFSSRERSYTARLPESGVTPDKAGYIKQYISDSDENSSGPTVRIGDGNTIIIVGRAPDVALFSSRGPNVISSDILKPDVSAPGVDILAAWSGAASPVEGAEALDRERVEYNIISGTSMATPHVTGAAALVKSLHPTWSPAAIKSALMTTADPIVTNTDGVIAYGAGQINITRAAAPGLVFDTTIEDYMLFLCASGYTENEISLITNETCKCPQRVAAVNDLNYPSIAISDMSQVTTVARTVTNVGHLHSTYTWSLESPIPGVVVNVYPDKLAFKTIGEKQKFTVKLVPQNMPLHEYGFLIWTDGTHNVRVPISVQTPVSSNNS